MSSIYEAMKTYQQDIDKLDTEVDLDKLESCNECGERYEDGMILYPVRKACVTIQCGNCGTVYDEWKDFEEGEASE